MPNPSQTDLERKYLEALKLVSRGETLEKAYGQLRDWFLKLDDDIAMLNPLNGTWYMLDRGHSEWLPTGFAAGQAIMVSIQGMTGAKIVPYTGKDKSKPDIAISRLADYCLWIEGKTFNGPDLLDKVLQRNDNIELIWSPRYSRWMKPYEFRVEVNSPYIYKPLFCAKCGHALSPDDSFCSECGTHIA